MKLTFHSFSLIAFFRHSVTLSSVKEAVNRDQCGDDVKGNPLSFKVVLFNFFKCLLGMNFVTV